MEFDGFVTSLTDEHALFTTALKGILLSAVVKGNIGPSTIAGIESEAYRLGKIYYDSASQAISRHTATVIEDGSEALVDTVEARTQSLLDGMRQTVAASIKEATIAARAIALGQRMTADQLLDVTNYVKSPGGKRWVATKWVRSMARDFAYQSAVDRDFDRIITGGLTTATVRYENETGREYENVTLTVPELADLRQKIFHINASARLSYV